MSYTLRHYVLASSILGAIILFAFFPVNNTASSFHTEEELRQFHKLLTTSTIDSTQYFPTATLCSGCHGYDPQGFALVDSEGNDVNMHDDWRATMMANSAKDPFWRAKVSHEMLVHPNYVLETQDKCTSCHAPMGHTTAHLLGASHYTMDDLLADTIGLDGVSCGACHQISEDSLGQLFSGEFAYDTNRVQFGPYFLPFAAPMADFVGFTPVYSEHILDAGICAPCHTLITNTFGLDGEPNGDTYVEQATYHEWLNSTYETDDVSCQSCHMPQIQDSVIISDNYNFLQGRQPYGLHEMVGGNVFMLNLMKANRDVLEIDANANHFDATIASTLDILQKRTLDLELNITNNTLDSLFLNLKLKNKAGHKFPSGYPSRRAYIELLVVTVEDDTIFHSGKLDQDFEVVGHDPFFEPHYQIINDPEQVQIYEVIPADVNGNFTSVLERAAFSLKDNRLTPVGFTTSHPVYDTTAIIGNALTDADFNYENGMEGSGTDVVQYHIPRAAYNGGYVNVIAKVHYQSLPPKWMQEIFAESTPEIDAFKTMYYETDQTPVLIAEVNIDSVFLDIINSTDDLLTNEAVAVSPNPTTDGWVNITLPEGHQFVNIDVFSLNGQLMESHQNTRLQLPIQQGIYIIKLTTDKQEFVKRVVRL